MTGPRIAVAIGSLLIALVFLLFDVYDVNLMLGETRVAIDPVAFFALLGVVSLLRPYWERWRRHEPRSKPPMKPSA
jgi:hypothetical protein